MGRLRTRVPWLRLLGLVGACLAFASQADAQCNQACYPEKFAPGNGTEFYFNSNVPQSAQLAFGQAAGTWNDMHASYGQGGMNLDPGNSGLEIRVETPTLDPDIKGEWDPSVPVIRINPSWLNSVPAPGYNELVAFALHEFGHQLGFDDRPQSGCYGWTVMGPVGALSPTTFESTDYCGFNRAYDPVCEAGGGHDYENHCTPLVLTFNPSNARFSRPDVFFDLAATGILLETGWTLRPVDGFLVLDRNGDGSITDGRELFGNSTPLGCGLEGPKAFTGFNALAVFDKAANGGNENGMIDPGDAVFSRLRVWFDHDRDGVSLPSELVSLTDLGVASISLGAWAVNRTDNHGNLIAFAAAFFYWRNGELRTGEVVDVVFKTR